MASSEQSLGKVIAADLREEIASGRLQPGDTIPTERSLMKRWDVSRTPVREALSVLTAEGHLTEGHGRLGRQVRDSKPLIFYAVRSESRKRMAERMGLGTDAWVTDAQQQGRKASQDIAASTEEATPDIARRLDLPDKGRVVARRRIRYLDGVPHDRANTFYPADIADGTRIANSADIPEGAIAYMAALGYDQVRYTDEVTARMPTLDDVRDLRIAKGTPVIVTYRCGYTATRPVKLTVTTWPADRVRLVWEFEG